MASLRPLNVQHPNLLNIIKQINNARKSTITNAINALESSFKTAHIHAPYYPTNTYSWLLLLINIVIQLQNEPNARYYIKLCMEDYLYLLECCNICLNGTESTVLEFHVDGTCIGMYDKSTPHGTTGSRAEPVKDGLSQLKTGEQTMTKQGDCEHPNTTTKVSLSHPLGVPFTLNSKPTSLFSCWLEPASKREQKGLGEREFSETPVPGHWARNPVSTVYDNLSLVRLSLTGSTRPLLAPPFLNVPLNSRPFCSLFACDSKRKRDIGLDFNANGISNTDVALQLYLINWLSKYSYRNLDPELYNLLINYMNTMLADSEVIQNVIAIYTNIRKLEFLTNTMYIDQFRTLYICVSKIRAEYIRNRSHKEHVTLDVSSASKRERHNGTMYTVPEQKAGAGLKLSVGGTVLPEQNAGVGMTDNNINGDRIIELSSRTLLANMPGIDVDASRVDFPGINMDTFYKLFRLKHTLTDVSREVNIPDEPDMLDDETNIDALNNKDYVLDKDDLN
jgi:hypothetical protein